MSTAGMGNGLDGCRDITIVATRDMAFRDLLKDRLGLAGYRTSTQPGQSWLAFLLPATVTQKR